MEDIVIEILGVVTKEHDYITDEFILNVLKRLESFSYVVGSSDIWLIGFSVNKVLTSINNKCNTSGVNQKLLYLAVDLVCGEILDNLNHSGKLDEGFNIETAIKSVKMGDTDITFDVSQSAKAQLESLISHLKHSLGGDIYCCRKIKWV